MDKYSYVQKKDTGSEKKRKCIRFLRSLLRVIFRIFRIPVDTDTIEGKFRNLFHMFYLLGIFYLPFQGLLIMIIQWFGYGIPQHILLFINTAWFAGFNFLMAVTAWIFKCNKKYFVIVQSLGLGIACLVLVFSFENSFLVGSFLGVFVLTSANVRPTLIMLYSLTFCVVPSLVLFVLKMVLGQWIVLNEGDTKMSFFFQFLCIFGGFVLISMLLIQTLVNNRMIQTTIDQLLKKIEKCDFKDEQFRKFMELSYFSSDAKIVFAKIYEHLTEYSKMLWQIAADEHSESDVTASSDITASEGKSSRMSSDESTASSSLGIFSGKSLKCCVKTVVCLSLNGVCDQQGMYPIDAIRKFERVLAFIDNICTEKRGRVEQFNPKTVFVCFLNSTLALEFAKTVMQRIRKFNEEVLSDTMRFIEISIGISRNHVHVGYVGTCSKKTYTFFGQGREISEKLATYGFKNGLSFLVDENFRNSVEFVSCSGENFNLETLLAVHGDKGINYIRIYTVTQNEKGKDNVLLSEHEYIVNEQQTVEHSAIEMLEEGQFKKTVEYLLEKEMEGSRFYCVVQHLAEVEKENQKTPVKKKVRIPKLHRKYA